MRKKTIEQELEELEREKEEHIKNVSSKTGHTNDHVYDFDAKYETHEFEAPEMRDSIANRFRENQNIKTDSWVYVILIIPMLMLIGFIAGGISLMVSLGITPLIQQASFIEVTSTVQNVEIKQDSDGDFYALARVSYTYDGDLYSSYITKYISSMESIPKIGEKVTLKINPSNPTETIRPSDNTFGNIACIVFGFVMALIGLIAEIKFLKEIFKQKRRS